jgi:protease I
MAIGALTGKKVGVLLESDFYEHEIFYYDSRWAEEGIEVHYLSRLWGNDKLTFKGHEYKIEKEVSMSFETIDDETLATYSAIIIPSGMVSDRLRYTEDVEKIPPATEFVRRAFAKPNVIKGIICHGLWLVAPAPELVRGRRLTCHNNLLGDAKNMGAVYVNEDVVIDGDLTTGRTGGHAHLFARTIIDQIAARG